LPAKIIEAVASHHLPARELPAEFTAATALHFANALENAAQEQTDPASEKMDLDYPAELRLAEQMETLRGIASAASTGAGGGTRFLRRSSRAFDEAVPVVPRASHSPVAAELAPNGWWSRFRSLLAT
jgi:hypothetical protein